MYGNPHSRTHAYGWESLDVVETGREQVASLIGANPKEVIFTSGATESNNMAIKGVANFYGKKKNHVITTVTEHKCVLDSCRALQQQGFEITCASAPRPCSCPAALSPPPRLTAPSRPTAWHGGARARAAALRALVRAAHGHSSASQTFPSQRTVSSTWPSSRRRCDQRPASCRSCTSTTRSATCSRSARLGR